MKKIALFALAALCVSAAQAWTVKWSATENIAGTSQSLFDGETTSFSIAAKVTIAATTNDGSDDTLFSLSTGNVDVRLYKNQEGFGSKVLSIDPNAQRWAPGLGETSSSSIAGEHVLVLTFTKADNGNAEVDLFWNDATREGWNQPTEANHARIELSNDMTVTFNENALWTIDEATIYEGALGADQIGYLVDNGTTVVPEPTALALLALGVAGLALKRKVA